MVSVYNTHNKQETQVYRQEKRKSSVGPSPRTAKCKIQMSERARLPRTVRTCHGGWEQGSRHRGVADGVGATEAHGPTRLQRSRPSGTRLGVTVGEEGGCKVCTCVESVWMGGIRLIVFLFCFYSPVQRPCTSRRTAPAISVSPAGSSSPRPDNRPYQVQAKIITDSRGPGQAAHSSARSGTACPRRAGPLAGLAHGRRV